MPNPAHCFRWLAYSLLDKLNVPRLKQIDTSCGAGDPWPHALDTGRTPLCHKEKSGVGFSVDTVASETPHGFSTLTRMDTRRGDFASGARRPNVGPCTRRGNLPGTVH